MSAFAVAAAIVGTVEAGTLAVTWDDCGGTHATVTALSPSSVQTGATETVTGTGTVDEEVDSAAFTATVTALGIKVASCSGDGTTDIVCKLPAGAGSVTVKALDFPIAAGEVTIGAEVTTSAIIPTSLAKVDVHIEATDQNKESLVCLNVHTEKALEASDIDCSTAACPDQCQCGLDKCGDVIDTCLADDVCAQGQACALACACGDSTCSLKCAAADPSSKALPVATCLKNNCPSTVGVEGGTLAVTWDDCGGTHATVTALSPSSVQVGSTETVTGTGTVDEDVDSAAFTATVTALGIKVASCSGDGTTDIVCKLPAGAGSVTVKALDFPISAGEVTIGAEVTTSAIIPASLAKVDVHIEATDQNKESLVCLNVHTEKEFVVV